MGSNRTTLQHGFSRERKYEWERKEEKGGKKGGIKGRGNRGKERGKTEGRVGRKFSKAKLGECRERTKNQKQKNPKEERKKHTS